MRRFVSGMAVLVVLGSSARADDLTPHPLDFAVIAGDPCTAARDALGLRDPQLPCRKLAHTQVGKLGAFDIYDVIEDKDTTWGIAIVLRSAAQPGALQLAVLPMTNDCATTHCLATGAVAAKPHTLAYASTDDHGKRHATPALAIELDVNVRVTPTTAGTGKPWKAWQSTWIACTPSDAGVSCQQVVLGGPYGTCHPRGWDGATVQVRCDEQVPLAP
ncbi:MAG TPA: hypothetical protein VFQ53_17700 [Kofleriaceae bacterium]|nr:hypothetical protein [Kofleriaceae bacterium]